MSEKVTCPGCGSTTSSILHAFTNDEPCPYCNLSATAAREIREVRSRIATKEFTERYEAMVKELDRTRGLLAKHAQAITTIREALEDLDSSLLKKS